MKVLVANRGEIAIRIFRTCREMGISSAALYSDVDEVALHIRFADEAVCLGEANSYLNIKAVVEAAKSVGADAVHPGYGFLSENPDFARTVEEAGLMFIGPRSETISRMGDKLSARKAAREVGLPVLPGPDSPLDDSQAVDVAAKVHYPVLIKAAAGGGGRGIFLARSAEEFQEMVSAARREAQAVFGDDTVYFEPLVQQARHIEVQILGDGRGNILCLGDRECSIQRRRQKLIEEAPAPNLAEDLRLKMQYDALRLGKALKYRSLGTVEFLLDHEGNYYFIEVNPRIQVEHPVTEMISGVDLVREQFLLAFDGPSWKGDEWISINGAAIEGRILAEDAENGFLPAGGVVEYLKEPGGPGVRVDSLLYPGVKIGTSYDSLLSKVITWGTERSIAIQRLKRALGEYRISGVPTDLNFLTSVIDSPRFQAGDFDTGFLDDFKQKTHEGAEEDEVEAALAVALLAHQQRLKALKEKTFEYNSWQMTAWKEQMRSGF